MAKQTEPANFKADGVWVNDAGVPRRITGPFKVLGLVRDWLIKSQPRSYGLVLAFTTIDKRRRKQVVTLDAVDEPLCGHLLRQGLWISHRKEDRPALIDLLLNLLQSLQKQKSAGMYRAVQRTGWFGNSYIRENGQVLGTDARLIHQPTYEGPPLRIDRGTLKLWKTLVARPARYSTTLMFTIGLSFGTLVMRDAKTESGTIHLVPGRTSSKKSTKGKTTAQMTGQSVNGPATAELLLKWDVTAAGSKQQAEQHCDRLLVLDEISRLGKTAAEIAQKAKDFSFMLAGSMGRIYDSRYDQGNRRSWRTIVLSSGETSISDIAFDARQTRLQGDVVRMIDLPAYKDDDVGIFDRLPTGRTANGVARRLEKALGEQYGTAGPAFLRRYIRERSKLKPLLGKYKARFMRLAGVPNDSYERRFADRFALPYAALLLARRFQIVDWRRAEILRAVAECYRNARTAIPNAEEQLQTAIEEVQKRVAAGKGLVRVRTGHKVPPKSQKTSDGYIRRNPTTKQLELLLTHGGGTLERWLGSPQAADVLTVHLHSKKILSTKTYQIRLPGIAGKPRYHRLDLAKLKAA